ncbi:MAG: hypothetical protein KY466_07875 [Gemmatimonadetes bacterium]|nr:hypothetical protein [Gemmatimonadota bacterium]
MSHAAPLRDGFALMLAMLIVMAVAVLSAGMLAVAGQEARIAAAAEAATHARADADAAVRRIVADWSTRRDAALEIGAASERIPAPDVSVRIERLDTALLLVTARARSPFGADTARASAGALVRVLRPGLLARKSVSAALTAGSRADIEGGVVSGFDACAAGPSLPGLLAPIIAWSSGALEGVPAAEEAAPPPAPLEALPLMDIADLLLPGGAGTPRPLIQRGECVLGTWSWGSLRADHPCGTLPPLVLVRGDLTITGGQGAGILIVDGDLVAGGDFTFHGLIIVRGRALLDGATVLGALRADRVQLRTGTIRFDSCLLAAAFRAPALDGAFRFPDRWWVPTF